METQTTATFPIVVCPLDLQEEVQNAGVSFELFATNALFVFIPFFVKATKYECCIALQLVVSAVKILNL